MGNQKQGGDVGPQPPARHGAAHPVRIDELGLLSDQRTGALVTRSGTVVWYCPGRFDAPSLLASLLDVQRGGSWALEMSGGQPAGRRYLSDSAILESRLRVAGTELVITDFLPLSHDLPRGLCRIFSAAPASYQLILRPAPDYARRRATLTRDGEAVCVDGQHWLYSSHSSDIQDDQVIVTVPPGEAAWAFLSDGPLDTVDWELVTRWREDTLEAWNTITTDATYHGPYEEAVRASLRALRMLTDSASGGTIAAPTTSLPEVPGGLLNWDYRYVWLRDAAMVVSAMTRVGGEGLEGRRFLDFICGYAPRSGGLPLAPFLAVNGEDPPVEETLDLAGYDRSRPVRIGNGARDQLQHDAYGNVLLAAKLIYQRFETREHWPVVERLADYLSEHWRKDDYGIWEERKKRPYVAGKVLASSALRGIAKYAARDDQRQRWLDAADEIRVWVGQHGLTKTGAYAYVAGGEDVDITAALFPVWGYCAADTPEMLATVRELELKSCRNHLYWRHLEGDGNKKEGAFLAGTFWMAQYWAMRDTAKTRIIMDAALQYANDLGLLPEEADPVSGHMLGNFPQTFVHAALIGAAIDLRAAEQQEVQTTDL